MNFYHAVFPEKTIFGKYSKKYLPLLVRAMTKKLLLFKIYMPQNYGV